LPRNTAGIYNSCNLFCVLHGHCSICPSTLTYMCVSDFLVACCNKKLRKGGNWSCSTRGLCQQKFDCRVCWIFCSMWSIYTHSAMELNNRVACPATLCWTTTLWSGVSFIISGSNLQFFHRFLLMGLVELCYYWTCVFLCWWWVKELVLGPTPRGKRKVIIATNIAETSVTLEVGTLTCNSLSLFHVCWVFVW
jgi:hypothetical protein